MAGVVEVPPGDVWLLEDAFGRTRFVEVPESRDEESDAMEFCSGLGEAVAPVWWPWWKRGVALGPTTGIDESRGDKWGLEGF